MNKKFLYLGVFTLTYLLLGGIYFLQDFNLEFVIYIAVIVAIFGGVLLLHKAVRFPMWMLWMLSIWGLMHVLGGAVPTSDGVLFAYRIFPFLDLGGEFYILKYDQVVHFYLYGLVALMAHHILTRSITAGTSGWLVSISAILISVGVSALNEIMEFLISIFMVNGVGGYENTMLDICFNLVGALIAVVVYNYFRK